MKEKKNPRIEKKDRKEKKTTYETDRKKSTVYTYSLHQNYIRKEYSISVWTNNKNMVAKASNRQAK